MALWRAALLAAVLAVAGVVSAQSYNDPPPNPLDKVNNLIGTGGYGYGIGQNNPGAQYPFGVMRLGPDTSYDNVYLSWNHFGGYYIRDTHIRAFSHTHTVGAGLGDLGNFGVMPLNVQVPTATHITRHGYRSAFDRSSEVLYPGFYSVFLDTAQVRAELTVGGHITGAHRYTFAEGSPMTILIDVCHDVGTTDNACRIPSITITDDGAAEFTAYVRYAGSLTGRNGQGVDMWLYGRFDNATALGAGTWADGVVYPDQLQATSDSQSLGGYLYFGQATASSNSVTLTVGISFVDAAGARNNHDSQLNGRSFDQAKEDTVNYWADQMAAIAPEVVADEETEIVFYTSLSRTLMSPSKYVEVDGRYFGMDNLVHTVSGDFEYYSDMSLWDSFRTQNPWLVLTQEKPALDIARSLIVMYQEGGSLPRWPIANVYTGCMFGDNFNMVLLDTYIKGLTDFNFTAAYEGMRDAALAPQKDDSRGHLESYIEHGFIPIESYKRGVCSTLAYAYNDWCVARAAEIVGATADVPLFDMRAQYYRNHFDNETFFMCNRYADGTMACPQTDFPAQDGFVEGNQWHYFLDVPHDVEGLISMYPSPQAFVDKLEYNMQKSTETRPGFDTNFMPNPYYWAGNEHDLLFPWLFNKAGRADRTQYWTRWLMANRYNAGADGLPGNDDYATMSAWYTFGALGLYPVTGADYYYVGSPTVDEATVVFCKRHVTVVAVNNSATNVFVSAVTLNGAPLETPFITQAQLCGSTSPLEIRFTMSSTAGGFM